MLKPDAVVMGLAVLVCTTALPSCSAHNDPAEVLQPRHVETELSFRTFGSELLLPGDAMKLRPAVTPLMPCFLPQDENVTHVACAEFGSPEPFLSFGRNRDLTDGLFGGLTATEKHHNTGFLDFNYYWDSRDFDILTINAGAKLPHDFEYFQFLNFSSPLDDASQQQDWTDFFTELHLRRPIAKDHKYLKHLDWNVMWADGSVPQGVGRLGVRWRCQDTPGWLGEFVKNKLKLKYSLTIHALESDGSGWQLEHVFRRDFCNGLIYVGGFTDHNIKGMFDSSAWVSETQIGVKLCGNLFAVAEFRYTSYAPSHLRRGIGIGIEYVVAFR